MDSTTIITIVTSAPAIALYVVIVGYVFHRIAQAKQWDEQKWDGMIHQAILATNAAGIAPHEPDWLKTATTEFEKVYAEHNGGPPTADDLKDATADLARVVGPYVLPLLTGVAGKILGGGATPAPAPAPAPKPGS